MHTSTTDVGKRAEGSRSVHLEINLLGVCTTIYEGPAPLRAPFLSRSTPRQDGCQVLTQGPDSTKWEPNGNLMGRRYNQSGQVFIHMNDVPVIVERFEYKQGKSKVSGLEIGSDS